jgi:hypothetical protein
MCRCFGNMYTVHWLRFLLIWLRFFLPWLRVFRAFSSVVRQIPGQNSQRRGTARTLPHYLLFVLFYVLFVCKCVLPPGDNPISVNKYIISYLILPEYIHTEGTNCSVHVLGFLVQTSFQYFLFNKSRPILAPNDNEKIQWSSCQGDNSGLEEGIPWQIWCPCRIFLARASMQHVPVLTQLYVQTSYQPSPTAYHLHCNKGNPRPTNGLFSIVSRSWSL